LHKVLDGKVLVALDGKVLNTDNGVDGDPNLVNLVLGQKGHEGFHVILMKLHRQLFVVLEHFSNQETELLFSSFDQEEVVHLIKKTSLDDFALATEQIQESEALLADFNEPGVLLFHGHVNWLLEDIHDVCQDSRIVKDTLVCWVGLSGIVGQRAQLDQFVKDPKGEK